eukprot:scpid53136/ scgid10877/ 
MHAQIREILLLSFRFPFPLQPVVYAHGHQSCAATSFPSCLGYVCLCVARVAGSHLMETRELSIQLSGAGHSRSPRGGHRAVGQENNTHSVDVTSHRLSPVWTGEVCKQGKLTISR